VKRIRIGFSICGSFCTIANVIKQIELLKNKNYDFLPIMTENAIKTDTKFGKAKDIVKKIEKISSKKVLTKIEEVEPIGPKNLTDLMLVAPCTSNTLSKLTNGIVDNAVTLAVKSHLRETKPVLVAFASNDALGTSAKNLGVLLNTKNFYFVPLSQDDPKNKPNSLVAHFELIEPSIKLALKRKQIQPIFYKKFC
jgi:dipicolinate synthase subunit B